MPLTGGRKPRGPGGRWGNGSARPGAHGLSAAAGSLERPGPALPRSSRGGSPADTRLSHRGPRTVRECPATLRFVVICCSSPRGQRATSWNPTLGKTRGKHPQPEAGTCPGPGPDLSVSVGATPPASPCCLVGETLVPTRKCLNSDQLTGNSNVCFGNREIIVIRTNAYLKKQRDSNVWFENKGLSVNKVSFRKSIPSWKGRVSVSTERCALQVRGVESRQGRPVRPSCCRLPRGSRPQGELRPDSVSLNRLLLPSGDIGEWRAGHSKPEQPGRAGHARGPGPSGRPGQDAAWRAGCTPRILGAPPETHPGIEMRACYIMMQHETFLFTSRGLGYFQNRSC